MPNLKKFVKEIIDTTQYEKRGPDFVKPPWNPYERDTWDYLLDQEFEGRLKQLESYLEKDLPKGKPFIRLEERPAVGLEIIQDVVKKVDVLNEKVDVLNEKVVTLSTRLNSFEARRKPEKAGV